MSKNKVNEALLSIQREFKSTKDKYNEFAKFNYRSAETMYASLKPLLEKYNCIMTFSEEPMAVGDSLYIKSTARLTSLEDGSVYESTSCVRDGDDRKGLSWAQGSGCCLSYLRKYVLCGMLLVDDGTDDDAISGRPSTPAPKKNMTKAEKINSMVCEINTCTSIDELQQKWTQFGKWTEDKRVKDAFTARKKQIINP